ncbi:MAG: hypothetical protein JXB49_26280 [Bacteroidales bacterium]|nr:hypothetical protein [Bacteroidales bacterium]
MGKIIKIIFLLFIAFLWNCSKEKEDQAEWQRTSSIENIKGCNANAIVIDKFGNKWVATSKGLVLFADNWYAYMHSNENTGEKINDLIVNDGRDALEVWLATDYGVYVLSLNEQLEVDKSNNYTRGSVNLMSDTVNNIVKGKGSDIWFLTEKGISFFDEVWHKKSDNRKIDVIPIISALFPVTGSNYCGRQRDGMITFDYSQVDGITGASEWVYPYNGIILDTVNYIYKSNSDELWLACFGNPEFANPDFPKDGLIKHMGDDPKAGFTYYNNITGGLINNRINCIAESPEGKIWLATEGGIAYQINDTLFGNYTTNNGLVNNYVLCLAFDLDGSLWCGTKNGVSHYKDGVFTNYLAE